MEPVTHNTIRAGEVANMVNYLLKRTEKAPSVTNAEMQHALKTAVRTHVAHHPKAKEQPPARHKPIKMGGPGEAPTPDEIEAAKPELRRLYREVQELVLKFHAGTIEEKKAYEYLTKVKAAMEKLASEPDNDDAHRDAVEMIGNLRDESAKKVKGGRKAAAIAVAIADADAARKMIPSKEETRQAKAAKQEEIAKVPPIIVETDLVALVKLVPTQVPLHETLQDVLEAERAYAKALADPKGQDPKRIQILIQLLKDTSARVTLFTEKLEPGDPYGMIGDAVVEEARDVVSPPTAPASYVDVAVVEWNHAREDLRGVEIALLQVVGKIDRKSALYRRAVEVAIALREWSRDPDNDTAKGMVLAAADSLDIIIEAMPEESPDRLLAMKVSKAAHEAAKPR